jgi:hypothetical protein
MIFSADPSDLAENRAGRISPAQLAARERELRHVRRWYWVVPFLMLTFVIAAAIFGNTRSTAAIIAFAAVEVAALGLCMLTLRWLTARALVKFREDRIECAVGRLCEIRLSPRGNWYRVNVGDRTLGVPLEVIRANRQQLEAQAHRVYFLSRLGYVVAIEPDRPA